MDSSKTIAVTVSRRLAASPERVFDAWLDPELARRWLFTTPQTGISRCDIDPRVGGCFTIVDHRDDGDIEHVGEYRVIERPHLLVFTFAVPQFSPLHDLVTVRIRAVEGGCELTLTNEMDVANEGWRDQTVEGWTMILASLAREMDA